MTKCFLCGNNAGLLHGGYTNLAMLMQDNQNFINSGKPLRVKIPEGMTEKDKICSNCITNGLPTETISGMVSSKGSMPAGYDPPDIQNPPESQNTSNMPPKNSGPVTSAAQLRAITQTLHDQTKSQWDKNGVVQYKDNKIAILKRVVGQQVQFIVACSKVTEEGYRLMSVDEGMTAQGSGFTGGASAYFYFQKMDYVR